MFDSCIHLSFRVAVTTPISCYVPDLSIMLSIPPLGLLGSTPIAGSKQLVSTIVLFLRSILFETSCFHICSYRFISFDLWFSSCSSEDSFGQIYVSPVASSAPIMASYSSSRGIVSLGNPVQENYLHNLLWATQNKGSQKTVMATRDFWNPGLSFKLRTSNQLWPTTINNQHQHRSTTIDNHQQLSTTINKHQQPSTSINNNEQQSTTTNRNQQQSTTIDNHQQASSSSTTTTATINKHQQLFQ